MDDTLLANEEGTALVRALGVLLQDHKGEDVAVLDMRELNGWTDFFVIATVSSHIHRMGLLRHIKDYCRDRGIEIFRIRRKIASEDEWTLIDLGAVVVHLMTEKSRSFYELERLWNTAPVIRL
ncbi:MAG: ribosome silencing factor [Treponema sp.]|jgi:ribosome-associated protein|nr:ribosome silencing factor [Treponema sp.]